MLTTGLGGCLRLYSEKVCFQPGADTSSNLLGAFVVADPNAINSAYIGLTATIIGAVIGSFLNEMYKRHRDARATAAALAGELASYKQAFSALDQSLAVLIDRAEKGEPLNIPEQRPPVDITYEAHVDKVGLLGPKLAEEVALVYGQIRGFRSAFFPITGSGQKMESSYVVAALRVAHMFSQQAHQGVVPLTDALRELANQSFWSSIVDGPKSGP